MVESRRYNPAHQCSMKRGYVSKAGARRAARQTASRGGTPLDTYRCPHCNRWHNGHNPRRAA